jgi:cell division protein FtsL
MNWEAIGALGEWVGALAVLATLAYLALQIKQKSQSIGSNIELEASSQLARIVSRISDDSNLKRIYDDVADKKGLSSEDERGYLWLMADG